MNELIRLTEGFRIPNFFRDILFIFGGIITVELIIFFTQQEKLRDLYSLFFIQDLNFLAIASLVSLSYFIGRLEIVLADVACELVDMTQHFIFHKSENFISHLMSGLKILVKGRFYGHHVDEVTKDNPNEIQIEEYLQDHKRAADRHERTIYTHITYSFIFVYSLILGVYISFWWFGLAALMILKRYQNDEDHADLMGKTWQVVRYENSKDEANKELQELGRKRGASYPLP